MDANENDQPLVRSVQLGYTFDIMSAVCANKMLNVDRRTCVNVCVVRNTFTLIKESNRLIICFVDWACESHFLDLEI